MPIFFPDPPATVGGAQPYAPRLNSPIPPEQFSCPVGAHFDGATTNMKRGAGLTGAVDSPFGIIFALINFTGGDNVIQTVARDAIADSNWGLFKLDNVFGTPNTIRVPLAVVAGGTGCYKDTTATLTSASGWTPILVSYDTNHLAGSRVIQIYFGDTDAGGTIVDNPPNVAFNVDITSSDWGIGAQTDNTWRMNADLAIFYFCVPSSFFDISIAANRRKFYDANMNAVDFGVDGTFPTGTKPRIYLRGPASTIAKNRGTGGDFAITGTITNSVTNPPCSIPLRPKVEQFGEIAAMAWQPPDPMPQRRYPTQIVSVDRPPAYMPEPGRAAVVAAWRQPDPYWVGGKQPSAGRPLSAILEDVSYVIPRQTAWLDTVLRAWLPPDPQPQRQLPAQLISGPVAGDNPPIRGSDRLTAILLAWQPPDPAPQRWRPLAPFLLDVRYTPAQQTAWLDAVIRAWQPPDPYWIGGRQPSTGRPFSSILEDASRPTPRDMRWLDVVVRAWQPPDPQPQRQLPKQTIAFIQPVDVPPRYRLEAFFAILRAWQPPDPQPQAAVPIQVQNGFPGIWTDVPPPDPDVWTPVAAPSTSWTDADSPSNLWTQVLG